MTFADEVKATMHKAPNPATKPAAPATEAKAATPAPNATPSPAAEATAAAVEPTPFDLPSGAKPVEPVAATKPVEAAPAKPAEPAKAAATPAAPVVDPVEQAGKKPIKIGTREFTDVNEALEYAKDIERQQAEDKAYIEGVKDASVKVAPADTKAQKTAYEKFSEEVFVDPSKAAKEFQEAIKQEIFDTYNQSINQQNAEFARRKQETEAWDNFYKTNPDLSSPAVRKIIEKQVITENWEQIKDLDLDRGFKKLGELARAEVNALKKNLLPTMEMPQGGAVTTSVQGDAPSAPTAQDSEKAIDFVSAINQFRKRGKK